MFKAIFTTPVHPYNGRVDWIKTVIIVYLILNVDLICIKSLVNLSCRTDASICFTRSMTTVWYVSINSVLAVVSLWLPCLSFLDRNMTAVCTRSIRVMLASVSSINSTDSFLYTKHGVKILSIRSKTKAEWILNPYGR